MLKLVFTLLMAIVFICTQAQEQKPNIIFFMVDDMGWKDCGAYGSKYYETPNIDKFAEQSVRFTNAYAHPLCSPSRASVLTGQEEARHGITSAHGHLPPEEQVAVYQDKLKPRQKFLLPHSKRFIAPETLTIGEVFLEAGYKTAHLGKWHVGLTKPYWPENNGFEVTFHSAPDPGPPASTYFAPHNVYPEGNPSPNHRVGNIKNGPDGEHITDRLTGEAIEFITSNRENPFYLNLWHYSVHGPWEAKEEYIKYFLNKKDPLGLQTNPVMAAMLKSVDESLGRIMETLDDLGLSDNTIVVFYSDNGGNVHKWSTKGELNKMVKNKKHNLHKIASEYLKYAGVQPPTNNAPLKAGKSKLHEGGIRVPCVIRWDKKIEAGSISDAIINNIDFYPTLLEMTNISLPENHIIDGVSFAPVVLDGKKHTSNTSFSWFPYHDAGISVRQGDWKLIRRFVENPNYYEGLVELYNLKDDIGETNNLAEQMPKKVKKMGKLIDKHFEETGGVYPIPNPDYKE